MGQDNFQIRTRGAEDFLVYYEFACVKHHLVPMPAVKMNLDKGMLNFNGDRLKQTDWPPVVASISINKHLHHIAISSASPGSEAADRGCHKINVKKKTPAVRSKEVTFKLCKALSDCLSVSPSLKTLHLIGLPLRERDLFILTRGLLKNTSLQNLSLAHCPISDAGLEIICQSVKNSSSIRTVDFTGCNLTWRGAEHMGHIIKHQGMQRHGTAWAESLRYRQPQFEAMGGLRRITLNGNILIGDRGVGALANELSEDLWVKAVDLQRCGLSNEGARRLLEALKTNSFLSVLDIRNNPLIDKVLIKTVLEKVLMNGDGQQQEYPWIKPESAEPPKASGPRRQTLHSVGRRKASLTKATSKKISGRPSPTVTQAQKSSSRSCYIPWRAAARASRPRGLAPGVTTTHQSFQCPTTVKVTVDSSLDDEEEDEEAEEEEAAAAAVVKEKEKPSSLHIQDRITEAWVGRLQMELKESRLRLAEERTARLKTESRLLEYELENARLRDANRSMSEVLSGSTPPASVLEDEAALESIERSFSKFHAFLDLLKDAGLGQLASIAGIDSADFEPVGRPQLSSTIEPHLDAVTALNRRQAQAQTDFFSRLNKALPCPADALAPRSVSTGGLLRDLTFTIPSGPAGGEVGALRFPGPEHQRHLSGSEHSLHSLHSHRSLGAISIHSKHNSNSRRSDSHHKNGSQGYSNTPSQASHSNGSHGGSSIRSSLGDALSDKDESARSNGSSGKGRLVAVGRSGSEGSEGKPYLGVKPLEQIRTLGCL